MPEMACTYRVLRYMPNIARDEWVNVGVVLHDPATRRLELRVVETESELARLRRIHPAADLDVVRGMERQLRAQREAFGGDAGQWVAKLDDTLSNLLQLSPQRAVLTEDFEAELDRLYREQVEPVRPRATAEAAHSRTAIRARTRDVFRNTGILPRMQSNFAVEGYTYAGDPMRLDFAFRNNGTRGFVQALALDRDPAQAKALAFTGERIREKERAVELTAVSDSAPRREDPRHRFVAELLTAQDIELVPLGQLEAWARRLSATLS
jgi:hypothetical protein